MWTCASGPPEARSTPRPSERLLDLLMFGDDNRHTMIKKRTNHEGEIKVFIRSETTLRYTMLIRNVL